MCWGINLEIKYRYFFNIRTVIFAIPAIPEQAILTISGMFGVIRKISFLFPILSCKQTCPKGVLATYLTLSSATTDIICKQNLKI